MAEKEKQPERDDVVAAHEYYKGVWRKAHAKWRTSDTYFNRTYPVWQTTTQAKTRGTYRPSTPTRKIQTASDQNFSYLPKVRRDPVTDTDTAKEEANEVEVSLNKIVADSALKETSIPWKQAQRHENLYGYFVLEGPLMDYSDFRLRDETPEDEYKTWRKTWNPIRIRATHPVRVLLDPEEQTPTFAIKESQVIAYKLHERSKHKVETRTDAVVFQIPKEGPYTPIDLVEWWSQGYHFVMVKDGAELWVESNEPGFVPFTHGFAGFGIDPADGTGGPEHRAVGLLDSVQESIRMESRIASAESTLLFRRAFAQYGTKGDSTEIAQQLARDGIVELDEDQLWLIPSPQMERWMNEAGAKAARDIEDGTFPDHLSGSRQPGVTTVGEKAIMTHQAGNKFAEAKAQLARATGITVSRICQLVDRIDDLGGHISVAGVSLKKSQLHSVYDVRASFEVVDPVLDLQRREEGMAEVQAGLRSELTFWEEDARIENSTREEDRLLRQAVRRHPGVHGRLAQRAAEEMGLGEEFAGAKEDEAAAAQDGRRSREKLSGEPEGAEPELRDPLTNGIVKPGLVDTGG